jgi:hypothetical protein
MVGLWSPRADPYPTLFLDSFPHTFFVVSSLTNRLLSLSTRPNNGQLRAPTWPRYTFSCLGSRTFSDSENIFWLWRLQASARGLLLCEAGRFRMAATIVQDLQDADCNEKSFYILKTILGQVRIARLSGCSPGCSQLTACDASLWSVLCWKGRDTGKLSVQSSIKSSFLSQLLPNGFPVVSLRQR